MATKKILFVGFYDDFARLYHGISCEIECNSYFVFQNISGYFYSVLRNFNETYLFFSIPVMFSFCRSSAYFKLSNDDLDYILEYSGKSTKFRRFLVKKLYTYWRNKMTINGINSILIAGDSRPISRLFKVIGMELDCKLSFFEQGPSNTTIIDSKGVNANCSFRSDQPNTSHCEDIFTPCLDEPFNRNLIYRTLDYIFDFVFVSIFFPIFSEKNIQSLLHSFFLRLAIKKKFFREADYSNKYILLILQVPEDANMVFHSPHFSSFSEMLKAVHQAMPKDYNLIVREHPLYRFCYESSLYSYIDQYQNIFLDTKKNLHGQINKSELVIVNNSTVGFEVILSKKNLMVLGDSYYDNYKYLTKLKNLRYLRNDINLALMLKVNQTEAENYISWCFSTNFIHGHFRSKNITNLSKNIGNRL